MLLQIKNISKSYPQAESGKQIVLDNIDLIVLKSETLSIVGPSGIGKSTLLNIIGGLDNCDSGEVIMDGNNLAAMNENELSVFRNSEIGFVFQLHYLLPQFNVIENILLPTLARKKKQDNKALNERVNHFLEKTGLMEHKYKYPGQLSVGECQRVAVVRSLINSPKLLLADEPTGSLDEHTAAGLTDLLLQINKEEKVAMIIATHAIGLASKMDKKLQLKQGKLHEQF
jgi:lipoprotein-releasing system ATP-binding protein